MRYKWLLAMVPCERQAWLIACLLLGPAGDLYLFDEFQTGWKGKEPRRPPCK